MISTTASLEDLPVASYCSLPKDATRDRIGPSRYRPFSVEGSLLASDCFPPARQKRWSDIVSCVPRIGDRKSQHYGPRVCDASWVENP